MSIVVLTLLAANCAWSAPAEANAPGLAVTFESLKDHTIDARSARMIALFVHANTPPTPFLAAGPFKATFEGAFDQKLRSEYAFSATGTGKLIVTIDGKPTFEGELGGAPGEKFTLKKGQHKIVATYESPAEGDAVMRLYWAGEDFLAEPLDPKLFSCDPSPAPLVAGMKLREGRALFADLRCARCHVEPSLAKSKEAMPEMAKDAPDISEIGARLKQPWIARWVSNPRSLRSDSTMPNLLHGKPGTTSAEGADIAAYLATLGTPPAESNPAPADAVVAGGRLVARLGCIGCHSLPDKDPDPSRVSWQYIKAKYSAASLVGFLKQPEKHYAWIRMPNFRLSDDEATKIAAYLLVNSKDLDGPVAHGDPAKGSQLIQTAGCTSCHTIKADFKPAVAKVSAKSGAGGCLAKDDASRGNAPDFSLTAGQSGALLAFLATDRASVKQDTAVEFAQRQVTELRCTACHMRDAQSDRWDDLIKETEALSKGDEINPESGGGGVAANGGGGPKGPPGEPAPGSGDQSRPMLTWTGEKLHPEWMTTFIAGKLDYKPRVWMVARMPGFPARAAGLARGLAMEHGCPPVSPQNMPPDPELANAGKLLVSANGGFSCIQCHGIADIAPKAPFEAPSINFKYASERLRKEYYDRWVRAPARITPNTKMPTFPDSDGKTPLRDVLDGDATKQFDAIWNYLLAGRKIEHPEQ